VSSSPTHPMEGPNVPIRLWDSKVGLSPPSPLAVCLIFFANKSLDSNDEDEELGFVLASLLTNYDVIYSYSYADFVSVLRVRQFVSQGRRVSTVAAIGLPRIVPTLRASHFTVRPIDHSTVRPFHLVAGAV